MKTILICFDDVGSISVRLLHAFLDKKEHDVTSVFLIDVSKPIDYNFFVKTIKNYNPGLVAIQVLSNYVKLSEKITKKIKKNIGCHVLWGGPHPTINPHTSLKYADFICVGEAEYAISELITLMQQNKPIYTIKNIGYKKNNKKYINPLRPLIQDLDRLPFPDFSDKKKVYIYKNKIFKTPPIDSLEYYYKFNYPIITSRGCPYNCTYCGSYNLKKIYGKTYHVRRRGVKNVIEELKLAKKMFPSIVKVAFVDDVFTLDIKWLKKFCKEYKHNINLPFYCHLHTKMADEEKLKLIKEANCVNVGLGIQSGSEKIRKEIFHRFESNKEIFQVSDSLKNKKIKVVYDVIVDNPYEEFEEYISSLSLFFKLKKPFTIRLFSLVFYPNFELTLKALKDKKISIKNVVGYSNNVVYHGMRSKYSKKSMFIYSLYSLLGKYYIPNKFIKFISQSKYLRKNPKGLFWLTNIITTTHYIYSLFIGLIFNFIKLPKRTLSMILRILSNFVNQKVFPFIHLPYIYEEEKP